MTDPALSVPAYPSIRRRHEDAALNVVKAIKRDYLPDMDSNDGGQILVWLLDLVEAAVKVESAAQVPASIPATPTEDRFALSHSSDLIEHFWTAVLRGWDIEPRDYFEKEAVAMGFRSPIEMAVHHMWKRHAKDWPNDELKAKQSALSVVQDEAPKGEAPQP